MSVQNTAAAQWPSNLPPFPGMKRSTQAKIYKVAQAALVVLAVALVWYLHATVPPLFLAPGASALCIPFEYLRSRHNVKQAQLARLRDVATSPEMYKQAPEIDEKFILEAIRANPLVFTKLEKEKREDVEFIKKAIVANPIVFEHLVDAKRYSKEYADIVSQVLYKSDADQIDFSKHYMDVKQLLKHLPHMFVHLSKDEQKNTVFAEIAIRAEPLIYVNMREINSPYLQEVFNKESEKRKNAVKKTN